MLCIFWHIINILIWLGSVSFNKLFISILKKEKTTNKQNPKTLSWDHNQSVYNKPKSKTSLGFLVYYSILLLSFQSWGGYLYPLGRQEHTLFSKRLLQGLWIILFGISVRDLPWLTSSAHCRHGFWAEDLAAPSGCPHLFFPSKDYSTNDVKMSFR